MILLNGGKPVVIQNISNAGQPSIVAPSMSFHNVAMEVIQCSRYIGEETGLVGVGHFSGCMLIGVIRFSEVVDTASGLSTESILHVRIIYSILGWNHFKGFL